MARAVGRAAWASAVFIASASSRAGTRRPGWVTTVRRRRAGAQVAAGAGAGQPAAERARVLPRRPPRPGPRRSPASSAGVPEKRIRPRNMTYDPLAQGRDLGGVVGRQHDTAAVAVSTSNERSASRCSGSRPVAGSSSTSRSGSPTSAAGQRDPLLHAARQRADLACASRRRGRRPRAPAASCCRRRVGVLLEDRDVVDHLERREARVEPGRLRQVAEPAPDLERDPSGGPGRAPAAQSPPGRGRARWPASAAAWSCRRRWGRAAPPRRAQRQVDLVDGGREPNAW